MEVERIIIVFVERIGTILNWTELLAHVDSQIKKKKQTPNISLFFLIIK